MSRGWPLLCLVFAIGGFTVGQFSEQSHQPTVVMDREQTTLIDVPACEPVTCPVNPLYDEKADIARQSVPTDLDNQSSAKRITNDEWTSLREHFVSAFPDQEQEFSGALHALSHDLYKVMSEFNIAYAAKCADTPTFEHMYIMAQETPGVAYLMALTSMKPGVGKSPRPDGELMHEFYQAFNDLDCAVVQAKLPKDKCFHKGKVLDLGELFEYTDDAGHHRGSCELSPEKGAALFFF